MTKSYHSKRITMFFKSNYYFFLKKSFVAYPLFKAKVAQSQPIQIKEQEETIQTVPEAQPLAENSITNNNEPNYETSAAGYEASDAGQQQVQRDAIERRSYLRQHLGNDNAKFIRRSVASNKNK